MNHMNPSSAATAAAAAAAAVAAQINAAIAAQQRMMALPPKPERTYFEEGENACSPKDGWFQAF